jgi:hypothetical protein
VRRSQKARGIAKIFSAPACLQGYGLNPVLSSPRETVMQGGYKEMSSIFADQWRPRNTSPNAGGGGELLGLSQ